MAVLVEAQGDMINHIETHVRTAVMFIGMDKASSFLKQIN
jgi:hypothetical protein